MRDYNNRDSSPEPQRVQDDEYDFPYHYISYHAKDVFQNCRYFSWALNYEATIEFILANVINEGFKSIVDIGCGDGRMTREIQRALPSTKVIGIDYSDRAIQLARGMNPNIEFQCRNIVNKDVNECYDAAILMEVFEHIPLSEAVGFARAVGRLLSPKGRLFLTVPHTNCRLTNKHFQHFSEKKLAQYYESDFKIKKICPFEVHDIRKSIIDRIMANKLFILRERHIIKAAYAYYKKHLFIAKDGQNYQRLYMEAEKRS